MTSLHSALVGFFTLAVCSSSAAADDAARTKGDYFETYVRPLLASNCYECHGPKHQESDIRLDARSIVLEGNAPLVIPGKPDDSRLIEVVRRTGDIKMPPESRLPDEAIGVLETWIKMGAPWPDSDQPVGPNRQNELSDIARMHWAFQPVRQPPLPAVLNPALVQSPIDRFVFARLDGANLTPAPIADRRTLIRRVTFDLIGLPPTADEVDAFVQDSSPDAWSKVVDRLLASPHYGERWARHWLDIARYADTKGYILFEDGSYPWAYTYRDYVIRSFNEDLPYDQFIREQIAADQIPQGEDKRPLAGLGFLTLGNRFIGNPHDIIDDRIDVVTRGLMALTVSCARCHDHKFDPIPTQDYYSLYGVMASSTEPVVPPLLEPPPATAEYEAFAKELAARQQKLAAYIDEKYSQVEQSARARCGEYLLAANALRDKPPAFDFMFIADGSDLNPTLVLRWQAYLEQSRRNREPIFALWHELASLSDAEFSQRSAEVIDELSTLESAAHPLVLAKVLEDPPLTLVDLANRYAEVFLRVDQSWQERLIEVLANQAPPTTLDDPGEEALRQVFYATDSPCRLERTPTGDLALLPDRASQDERRKLLTAIEEWWTKGSGAPPRAMALEDRSVAYDPRVFARGNPSNPRKVVPRRFLRILSQGDPKPFARGSGRLELAQSIASRENPLTARVLVNRVWMHHFGSGLVRTPDNFGMRGEAPTHPELLDFLAAAFMDEGWSLKKLHRTILLSTTYRQSSLDRPDCQLVDPENRFLWKFPRMRLDFESLRDALLFVGGHLERALYGAPNQALSDPDAFRRTIYSKVDRLNLPGLYRTFDFPNPDSSNSQRPLTTVPQQSLFLMNHALPEATAKRLIERGDVSGEADPERKVGRMYEILFARSPTTEETAAARDFLGTSPAPAVWSEYAHSLLMTNEFAFVD